MTEIVTTDQQVYRHAKATVYVAEALREQEFLLVPYLRCERLRVTVAPEIDQAELTYVYGDEVREDSNAVALYTPQDLNGKFVKVVINDTVYEDAFAADPETTVPDLSVTWYGIVEFDERQTIGSTPDPAFHPQGIQRFVAFGLLRLLEKELVRSAIIDIDGTEGNELTIQSGLPFNLDTGGQFAWKGNRSAAKVPVDGDSYVFDWATRGAAEWTAYTAVEYLLAHHSPKTSEGTAANTWRLDSDEDYLDWYEISEPTDGRDVKSIIDKLIPRFRAVGYWVDFDASLTVPGDPLTARNEVVLHVFTFLKTDLLLPNGQTLKANPNQRSLDFEFAYDIQEAVITNASSQQFHRIIARGAKRTTTFTARLLDVADVADDYRPYVILTPGWDSDDELEYQQGAMAASDYLSLSPQEQQARNSIYRSSDRLREVYRRWILNPNKDAARRWNGRVYHPHCYKTYDIDLVVDQDSWWIRGDLTADTYSALYDAESTYDGTDFVPALRVRRGLPLYERRDYSGTKLEDFVYGTAFTDSTHPSFIPLLVYARTKPGSGDLADFTSAPSPSILHRYELLDRLRERSFDATSSRDWSCRVNVTDTEPGVELSADTPHFLGGATAGEGDPWSLTSDEQLSRLHGGLDFKSVWVTLCVELTEHAEQSVVLSTPATDAPENVLIINVPNAYFDYVIPHTTVEIRDGLPVETTSGGAARNDLPRLKSIATAAAEWYSTVRQTLRLSWKQTRGTFTLGWLITDVGGRYQLTDINTPVTAITYDLGAEHSPGSPTVGSTTIETAFANLDFQ